MSQMTSTRPALLLAAAAAVAVWLAGRDVAPTTATDAGLTALCRATGGR